MSEIYHRYQRGEAIASSTLPKVNGGLELYGEVIHFDWRQDKATSQPDLFGEVWLQKVHPEPIPLTKEQQHLLRPPDTREGRRILEAQQAITI